MNIKRAGALLHLTTDRIANKRVSLSLHPPLSLFLSLCLPSMSIYISSLPPSLPSHSLPLSLFLSLCLSPMSIYISSLPPSLPISLFLTHSLLPSLSLFSLRVRNVCAMSWMHNVGGDIQRLIYYNRRLTLKN